MNNRPIALFIIFFLAVAVSAGAENFDEFSQDSQLDDLSPPVRCIFDAAAQNDRKALVACFSDEVSVNIAGMRFQGPEEVAAFAERDIWGGKYKIEKVFMQGDKEIVHCRFWPKGWSSPEPPIEYQFQSKNGKIINWLGKYR